MLDIIKAHAVKNLCYIAAKKMTPKGIVVHTTGAKNKNLKRYVDAPEEVGVNVYGNHWNVAKPGDRKVCVHAFIGCDKNKQIRVAEILPLDICCWGVGKGRKGSYNDDPAYIQFEICEDGLKDEVYYRDAFAVAAEYCADLCTAYGFGIEQIVGHCEAYRKGYGSNHADPEHWMKNFGETMADFREQVACILKGRETVVQGSNESSLNTTGKSAINEGDLVAIADDAVYYSGRAVPSWVKAMKWYVKEQPEGDRVVIDKNEKGTNSICSPIHQKYLSVVTAANKSVEKTENTSAVSTDCPYQVKVIADSLNIRKRAGTDNTIVGVITDKGVYTIVQEKKAIGASMWGKLKSGAGWISLDYTKKV